MTPRKIVGLQKPGFGDLNCPGDPGCPGYVDPQVNQAIQAAIAAAVNVPNPQLQQFPTTQQPFSLSQFWQQYQTPIALGVGGVVLFKLFTGRRR